MLLFLPWMLWSYDMILFYNWVSLGNINLRPRSHRASALMLLDRSKTQFNVDASHYKLSYTILFSSPASNLTTQCMVFFVLVPHRLQYYSKLYTKVCIGWCRRLRLVWMVQLNPMYSLQASTLESALTFGLNGAYDKLIICVLVLWGQTHQRHNFHCKYYYFVQSVNKSILIYL